MRYCIPSCKHGGQGDGERMFGCEGDSSCPGNNWYHAECLGVSPGYLLHLDRFLCDDCQMKAILRRSISEAQPRAPHSNPAQSVTPKSIPSITSTHSQAPEKKSSKQEFRVPPRRFQSGKSHPKYVQRPGPAEKFSAQPGGINPPLTYSQPRSQIAVIGSIRSGGHRPGIRPPAEKAQRRGINLPLTCGQPLPQTTPIQQLRKDDDQVLKLIKAKRCKAKQLWSGKVALIRKKFPYDDDGTKLEKDLQAAKHEVDCMKYELPRAALERGAGRWERMLDTVNEDAIDLEIESLRHTLEMHSRKRRTEPKLKENGLQLEELKRRAAAKTQERTRLMEEVTALKKEIGDLSAVPCSRKCSQCPQQRPANTVITCGHLICENCVDDARNNLRKRSQKKFDDSKNMFKDIRIQCKICTSIQRGIIKIAGS